MQPDYEETPSYFGCAMCTAKIAGVCIISICIDQCLKYM